RFDVRRGEVGAAAGRRRLPGLGRCSLRCGWGAGGLRGAADRLDLNPRQRRAKARLAPVAALRAPLADPHLVAADVADDLGRHLNARREVPVAVAAGEEDVRMERLPLVRAEAGDPQPLALPDRVLLAAGGGDRGARLFVEHAGLGARERVDCSGYSSWCRSPHSDIGTYSQSA